MFLYVLCFFLSISPSMVLNVMQEYASGDTVNKAIYTVKVFESALVPLQGFFNFFIYIKPLYTRFRNANPDKSMRFVLHEALYNPNIPQLNASENQSTVPEEADTRNLNRALFNSNFCRDSESSSASDQYPGGLLDLIADEDEEAK